MDEHDDFPVKLEPASQVFASLYMRRNFIFGWLCDTANQLLDGVRYDTIVGTGTSGVVAATVLAMRLNKKLAVVRKYGDGAHTVNMVEGALSERWLWVDDFVASGATLERVLTQMLRFESKCVGALLYAVTNTDAWRDEPRFLTLAELAQIPMSVGRNKRIAQMLATHAAGKWAPIDPKPERKSSHETSHVPAGTEVVKGGEIELRYTKIPEFLHA